MDFLGVPIEGVIMLAAVLSVCLAGLGYFHTSGDILSTNINNINPLKQPQTQTITLPSVAKADMMKVYNALATAASTQDDRCVVEIEPIITTAGQIKIVSGSDQETTVWYQDPKMNLAPLTKDDVSGGFSEDGGKSAAIDLKLCAISGGRASGFYDNWLAKAPLCPAKCMQENMRSITDAYLTRIKVDFAGIQTDYHRSDMGLPRGLVYKDGPHSACIVPLDDDAFNDCGPITDAGVDTDCIPALNKIPRCTPCAKVTSTEYARVASGEYRIKACLETKDALIWVDYGLVSGEVLWCPPGTCEKVEAQLSGTPGESGQAYCITGTGKQLVSALPAEKLGKCLTKSDWLKKYAVS